MSTSTPTLLSTVFTVVVSLMLNSELVFASISIFEFTPQRHLRPSQQTYDLTFSPLHRSLTSLSHILRPRQAVRLRHYYRANMLFSISWVPYPASSIHPKVLPPSRTSKRRRNNITNNKHSRHWQCWRRWHRGLLVRLHRHRCWFGFERG